MEEHTTQLTPITEAEAPSLESLRQHLWHAMILEQATLPVYLTALYSIKDGSNEEAASIIQSVAMEEMLHMGQAANLLSAIGGTPQIDYPGFVPAFPVYLPGSDHHFLVYMQKFCPQTIETFLKIEQPADFGAAPQYDAYRTIGQLYDAIKSGIQQRVSQHGEAAVFIGDPDKQVPARFYYGGDGTLWEVTDMASAEKAIIEIVDQGEGFDHGLYVGDRCKTVLPEDLVPIGNEITKEVAHYFRFQEILLGKRYVAGDKKDEPTGDAFEVDWTAVHDLKPMPKTSDYDPKADPDRWARSYDFDLTYTHLLTKLHVAFNHDPSELLPAVGTMYEVKYKAQALMRMPASDDASDTMTMAPAWTWVPPPEGKAEKHLRDPARRKRKKWLRKQMGKIRDYFDGKRAKPY